MISKMQRISVAFVEVNSAKFAYSVGIEDQIYIHFAEMLMLKCKRNCLNKSDGNTIRKKAHEVTRCVNKHVNRPLEISNYK